MTTQNTPYDGLRILDVTRYASGPIATQILADLGAEVLHVERPGRGEEGRTGQPFINGESCYFHAMNRNKLGITLNYHKEEGKKLFLDLAKTVDVIVENNAPGTMNRLGLGYEDVKAVNPSVIYCSISGFGQKDSPYIKKVALDGVAQAMGGFMSVNGFEDRPGVKAGVAIADLVSGYYACMGIQAALFERTRSGEGQLIDLAMTDAMFATLEHQVTSYSFGGGNPKRLGSCHSALGCTNVYPTSDGEVFMCCASDSVCFKLADAIGRPDLKEDPRFASNADRAANRDWIDEQLGEWFIEQTKDYCLTMFEECGIPGGPLFTMEDCFADDHFKQREMLVKFDHPIAGEITVPGNPIKLSRTPVRMETPGPVLGSSNEEVYGTLCNVNTDDLDRLSEEGII